MRICIVSSLALQFATLVRENVPYCLASHVILPVVFSGLSVGLVLRAKNDRNQEESGQVKSVFINYGILCVRKNFTSF